MIRVVADPSLTAVSSTEATSPARRLSATANHRHVRSLPVLCLAIDHDIGAKALDQIRLWSAADAITVAQVLSLDRYRPHTAFRPE